jgi:uncharacterized membrane protein required for colicin V production
MAGMRRGFIKEIVLLVGLIISIIISFKLRTPIATFMYKTLPFFSFNGDYSGVTVLNILLYETIAFLIIFSLIYLILRVLLKITGIIEKILKATIILGFFSKIGGAILGFIESYIVVFIVLFVLSQPFINIKVVNDSIVVQRILDSTPVMSSSIKNTRQAITEVYELTEKYRTDKKMFNSETIKLFIKYDIITKENVDILRKKGKID